MITTPTKVTANSWYYCTLHSGSHAAPEPAGRSVAAGKALTNDFLIIFVSIEAHAPSFKNEKETYLTLPGISSLAFDGKR